MLLGFNSRRVGLLQRKSPPINLRLVFYVSPGHVTVEYTEQTYTQTELVALER
jgi:hypothetical protein